MSAEPTTPRLLLSAREAAQALGICERSLWSVTKTGGLPCVRIGRRCLYDPADLRRWIESQKQGGIA